MNKHFLPGQAPAPSRASVVRRTVLTSILMLLLGIAAGFVWLGLAHPSEWEAVQNGIVLNEAAAKGQFSVVVVFVLIGAGTSLVWGAVAAWVLDDLGWVVTPVVIALTLLAAVIAWRIGVELGPPDPVTVTGLSIGDRVPSELKVDGLAPFLVWPIFGLVGVVGTMWATRHRVDERV